MKLRILALTLVLAVLSATRVAAAPDPASYFPPETALPTGFVHDPTEDYSAGWLDAAAASRWYQGSPGNINLIVLTADSDDRAAELYRQTLEGWQAEGVELATLADLGEEASVGYHDLGTIDLRVVLFRSGSLCGGVLWIDRPEERGEADVQALARQILEQMTNPAGG